MLDKLISLDQELFIYLNGLGVESWDAFGCFTPQNLIGFLFMHFYCTYYTSIII